MASGARVTIFLLIQNCKLRIVTKLQVSYIILNYPQRPNFWFFVRCKRPPDCQFGKAVTRRSKNYAKPLSHYCIILPRFFTRYLWIENVFFMTILLSIKQYLLFFVTRALQCQLYITFWVVQYLFGRFRWGFMCRTVWDFVLNSWMSCRGIKITVCKPQTLKVQATLVIRGVMSLKYSIGYFMVKIQ